MLNYHVLHLNLCNFCQSYLSNTGKKFQKKKKTFKKLKPTNMSNFNSILVLIIIFSVSGYIQISSDNIISMKIIHALINLDFQLDIT